MGHVTIRNNKVKRIWKEAVRACIKLLPKVIDEQSEENHKNISLDDRHPGGGLNEC
jgi:hypothetical protein